MGFNIDGPSFKPVIQEAQSMKNNGGGGNLGYFQREKKKKKKDDELDLFEKEGGQSDDDFLPPEKEKEKFSDKIKGLVNKLKKDPSKNLETPNSSKFFKLTETNDG